MKVILTQDVYNLGEEGDVCDVARGYARNYLLPKKLAVVYNNANRAVFESRKAIIENKKEEKRKAAMSLKERIEGMELTIPVSAGESGKLFGSVSSSTIAEALMKEGIEVEKKQIEVPSHTIKMVGNYTARVKLYEGETAELKINVESERAKSDKGTKKEQPEEKKPQQEEATQQPEEAQQPAQSEPSQQDEAPQQEEQAEQSEASQKE